MSTNISTIFDAISAKLNTIYSTTHKKLTNPYVAEENDEKTLSRGYGFFLGSGTNTNRQMECMASISREVNFINTIINRGTDRDTDIRQTAEKTLLEDQFLLIKELEKEPTISLVVAKMIYLSDNGIEQVYGKENNYLMIQSIFEIEYLEEA